MFSLLFTIRILLPIVVLILQVFWELVPDLFGQAEVVLFLGIGWGLAFRTLRFSLLAIAFAVLWPPIFQLA